MLIFDDIKAEFENQSVLFHMQSQFGCDVLGVVVWTKHANIMRNQKKSLPVSQVIQTRTLNKQSKKPPKLKNGNTAN